MLDLVVQNDAPLLLQNGRVIDPANNQDEVCDVRIEAGRVVKKGPKLPVDGARVWDCANRWVMPGFIDLHVHLREPGQTHKETIETGTRAAIEGGFATVLAMPNTSPPIDNPQVVAMVRQQARAARHARVLISGSITQGQAGESLAPMYGLAACGVVAFTDDGRPVPTAGLMRRALEYATGVDRVVISHAEDLSLSHGGHMHEGHVSCALGVAGIPREAESVCVARDILMAKLSGGRLHLAHLSTKDSVEMLREAKRRGLRVTAEVTPHHFALNHEAALGYDTFAKMNPPLREPADQEALIDALADGTIDIVATDHAPHSALEKDLPFDQAAFGIIGLETALPLTYDLVRRGRLSVRRFVEVFTTGPARVLGLPLGTLSVGAMADVTVFDPNAPFDASHPHSRSHNSPFLQRVGMGRAVAVVVGGELYECQPNPVRQTN